MPFCFLQLVLFRSLVYKVNFLAVKSFSSKLFIKQYYTSHFLVKLGNYLLCKAIPPTLKLCGFSRPMNKLTNTSRTNDLLWGVTTETARFLSNSSSLETRLLTDNFTLMICAIQVIFFAPFCFKNGQSLLSKFEG